MKRSLKWLCFLLTFCLIAIMPAQATIVETRASSFFLSYIVCLEQTSSNSFQIWFDVDAVGPMEEIGASIIHVYRSADGETWTKVRSYYKENYSNMTCENTVSHVDYVTYTGAWSGYYYRAAVTLYAREGTSSATRVNYTEIIKM